MSDPSNWEACEGHIVEVSGNKALVSYQENENLHYFIRLYPFNEEIERLEYAVEEAFTAGCVVSVLTEKGRISEDLQTTLGFCNRIHGLTVALDPSYYLGETMQSKLMDSILPFVNHVRLRDSKPGVYQTKVGQGDFEFGKLINQLDKIGYKRALSVDIVPQEDADHLVELRKMRMLLESLVL